MRIRTRVVVIVATKGLTNLASLALGILLVRLTDKETVGLYRQVMLVYVLAHGLVNIQLDTSLYYFLPKVGSDKRRTLILQTFLASTVFAALCCAVMLFGAGPISTVMKSPDLAPLLRVFSLYPFFNMIFQLVPAFMISLDRAVRAGVYGTIDAVAKVLAVVATVLLGGDLVAIMWSQVVASAVVMLVALADMVRLSPGRWGLDWSLIWEQFNYSWPFIAVTIAGVATHNLDRVLISATFGPVVYAVYSCGAMELPMVGLLTTSLTQAIMPNLVGLAAQGKKLQVLRLWHESTRKSSLILFPCFVLFLIISKDFMILLYGQEYAKAAYPFAIYLCMLPTRIGVYSAMLRAFGTTKPIAVGQALTLTSNAAVAAFLVWVGHGTDVSFVGPPIGTLCGTLVFFWYMTRQISHVTGEPVRRVMEWRNLGHLMLLNLLCGLLAWAIPLQGLPLMGRLTLRIVLFAVLVVCAMWKMRVLRDDEREALRLPLKWVRSLLGQR